MYILYRINFTYNNYIYFETKDKYGIVLIMRYRANLIISDDSHVEIHYRQIQIIDRDEHVAPSLTKL